jgi:hypothetical protein
LTTGSGGYSSNGMQGQATTTPLVVNQQSVVDYTPRMVSLNTTTGGVTFLKDANGKIVLQRRYSQRLLTTVSLKPLIKVALLKLITKTSMAQQSLLVMV